MPSSTTKTQTSQNGVRAYRLKEAVQSAQPGVCPERAVIWTQYHKQAANRGKSTFIQMAEALREVLLKKSISIYPDELIVGNFSSKRVGGAIYPELHGVTVMEDIFKFSTRETSPLEISNEEIRQLLGTVPFWIFRFLAFNAYKQPLKKMDLILDQLQARYYLINESGGVSHLAPDYEKLVTRGTDNIVTEVGSLQEQTPRDSDEWQFYQAVKIIADGLAQFGERYADLANKLAASEPDPVRKAELVEIASVCRDALRGGAGSFHGALQALFFAQIALNLESLDNAICPGRMDQYLYPFYQADIQKGVLTRQGAKELVAAFSIKMSEIIPVFSERITRFHGGMFNGQVVTVGGVDSDGNDAVNDLTYIFLEVMQELQMRQPNYHARIHTGSPRDYLDKVYSVLAAGSNSPALYNDEIIVQTMCEHGYEKRDARNYTGVGCVEPVAQGKSFASTDAALVNVPITLELALNEGKRFGAFTRSGAKTLPVSRMGSMQDVKTAFEKQLHFLLKRLIADLQAIEIANRDYHPTPLTSMLLDGCLQNGKCSTAGGAVYNFSGVQCVGPVDTGDALYAINQAVFEEKKISLPDLIRLLKQDIDDPYWLVYLRGLSKFGNDDPSVDQWTIYVVDEFSKVLGEFKNTRGGQYITGLYSVTAHQYFGEVTGALPHGRRKCESFSSGVAPVNGMDRKGPTALLNSVNRLDFTKTANGINLNLKFDSHTIRGETGLNALDSLIKTYFRRGGMQTQINILDPETLLRALDNPDLYPNLLVRVSGYSAYFNDLTPDMKDEIIRRSNMSF